MLEEVDIPALPLLEEKEEEEEEEEEVMEGRD